VFLGDGGTYAVGGALVLLASSASASWEALVGVVVCLGVFAFELGSTMIRRAINRESLVGGDRAHVYDLLSIQLASRTRATAAMIGVGVTMAALGFAASEAPLPVAIGIAAVVGLAGSVGVVVLWRRHRGVPRRSR
jgi:UDP-N-acetylmuramyl pentapeptide phosphotransferase/UDP-N-acetylglucosamine-1-phosphate transferase